MAKVAVALRLLPETLAKVDAYAAARGRSRQVVLEAAVDSLLDDVERGVPDLPRVEAPAPVPAPKRAAAGSSPAFADAGGTRQQRLNAAMLRSRSK